VKPPRGSPPSESNPAEKTKSEGDTCSATATSDDCKANLFCAKLNERGALGSYCMRPCNTHAQCPPQEKCQVAVYHADQEFKACHRFCSAYAGNECPSNQSCTWSKEEGGVCHTPGVKAADAACGTPFECASGLICFQGTCRQPCRTGTGSCTPAGTCKAGTCQQPADSGLSSDPKTEDPCLGVCI